MPDARAASELLVDHWQHGAHLPTLPDHLRPSTRAEGYDIQACLEALSAKPLVGWKIAATSKAGQQHIAVDGPLAGRILAEMVLPPGGPATLGANRMLVAEPEFAFRMARDLPPREAPYTQAEVMAAVASLHLAIEVPESRFLDFTLAGTAQLIADNACAHQWMLGPEAPSLWRDLDLSQHAVTGRTAAGLVHQGSGANVLGDPRIALTWLANELSAHGVTLGAGQYVTTGTCVVPIPIAAGDTVIADFGALGQTNLTFAA